MDISPETITAFTDNFIRLFKILGWPLLALVLFWIFMSNWRKKG